jgi:hypothetical protein
MEDQTLAELVNIGAGGLLAAAILRVVFDFLKYRAAAGKQDEESPLAKIATQLERQTELLQEIRGYHHRNSEGMATLSADIRELRVYFVNTRTR